MARKEDIIERLAELSEALGRDIDTTGSVAELELRLREAEEEFSAQEEGSVGDDSGDTSAAGGGDTAGEPEAGNTADALISIRVAKTLVVMAAYGKTQRQKIVRQGQEVTVRAGEFALFKPGLAKRVQ